jgi:hypothetical protein
MISTRDASNTTQSKLIVEATVIRACEKCGAPGMVNEEYVGDKCPSCGAARPPPEYKGEIYRSPGYVHLPEWIPELWWNINKMMNQGKQIFTKPLKLFGRD